MIRDADLAHEEGDYAPTDRNFEIRFKNRWMFMASQLDDYSSAYSGRQFYLLSVGRLTGLEGCPTPSRVQTVGCELPF